jgi:hypothetical protein
MAFDETLAARVRAVMANRDGVSERRTMDLTGRPLRGFVTVRPEGFAGDALRRWVELALEFAAGLPPKN